jgi:hypothetical protein
VAETFYCKFTTSATEKPTAGTELAGTQQRQECHSIRTPTAITASSGTPEAAGTPAAGTPEAAGTPAAGTPAAGTPEAAGTPAAGTPEAAGTPAAGTPKATGTPAAGTPEAGTPAAGMPEAAGTSTYQTQALHARRSMLRSDPMVALYIVQRLP